MSLRPSHITVVGFAVIALGACTNQAQASDDPQKKIVVVAEALPQVVEPMTLEEIRAKQEILEVQITEIRAKAELERADKIALIKLTRTLLVYEKKESQIISDILHAQKAELKKEFAEIRNRPK